MGMADYRDQRRRAFLCSKSQVLRTRRGGEGVVHAVVRYGGESARGR
jgi:hypothetical protein